MKAIILGLISALLLSGCNSEQPHQHELDQIDSLQSVLKDYRSLLDSLDTEGNMAIVEHVDTQYNYLLNNYPDMADRDFWLREVPQFGTIDKSLGRLADHKDEIREEIDYSDKQLITLRNSIEDEKLTEEEVTQYLESELRAVTNLNVSFSKYIAPSSLALKMWHVNSEPYDSIVNDLRRSLRLEEPEVQ